MGENVGLHTTTRPSIVHCTSGGGIWPARTLRKSIEHATEGDKGVSTKEGEKIAVCKRRDSIILLAMLMASFSDKGTVTHQVVVY